MKSLFRLALYLCFGLCAPVIVFGGDQWLYAKTDHCEIFSNASEGDAREALIDAEQFHAIFASLFPLPRAREPRMTIILFDEYEQYEPYMPLHDGKTRKVYSHYFYCPDEMGIELSATANAGHRKADLTMGSEDFYHDQLQELISQKYVHVLLHAHGINPLPWLEEGLSQIYSDIKVQDGKVLFGDIKPEHLEMLRRSPVMPLAKLFAVTYCHWPLCVGA